MKAFFDTNVYVNTFFRPVLPKAQFESYFKSYEVWICPLVKHELLLGTIHPKTKADLEKFFLACPTFEAPDREMWNQATELMKKMKWKESKHQNDVLIALTACRESALLFSYDKIFKILQKELSFSFQCLEEKKH
ncbi:MAG: PIN domain-containing protein [Deltaproteobacteria bacterium]|nr:PIN domain-containing protein [Deltaproteobacteria bacterium]